MKKMCAAPSSWKINSTKERKLFSCEEGMAAELTTQMSSVNISDGETGERRKHLSSSKSVDAVEANDSVGEEGSCGFYNYSDEVHALQHPEEEGLGEDCKTHSNSDGDVTPKRNLRIRTPLKNSVPTVEKGFGTGERDWSTQDKEKLLSILETDGFDGDFANLAAKLPNQTVDSIRYLITQCEEDREKPNWEVILDSKIEELRGMEGPTFSENLALFFQLHSSLTPDVPDIVGGVNYSAIYAYIASLMRGEIPKQLNPVSRAKLSQLFHLFKQRIQSEPEVPFPEFKQKAGSALERKRMLKERRSNAWSADELEAQETLWSGDVRQIEEFYLSHASLNPF